MDLVAMARILRGEVCGGEILCPGPGHSSKDRSLAVRFLADIRGGFVVYSFAGDDPQACRQHISTALGFQDNYKIRTVESTRLGRASCHRDIEVRIAAANSVWRDSKDARGTLAESYLASRGLRLDAGLAEAIRFHPRLKTRGSSAAAMVCLLRDVTTNEPCGIHRTYLDGHARKLGRRMLGRAHNAAVKLDCDADVTNSLTIGEGVETSLAARQLSLGPVWAVGSSGAIGAMPVLAGIEVLRVLAEHDANGANARSVAKVSEQWLVANREVIVLRPAKGDMNDVLMGDGGDD